MSSTRRPPPPPPKDLSPPPPLPTPRTPSTGNRQLIEPINSRSQPGQPVGAKKFQGTRQEQDDDDTYEQPTSHSNSDITSTARGGAINASSIQRESVAENSDSDGWSESEWDDIANLHVPSTTPLSDDNTYLMPEGGMIQGDYNIPDDVQVTVKESNKLTNKTHIHDVTSVQSPITSKLPSKIATNSSRRDNDNKAEIKSSRSDILKAPHKIANLEDQSKPVLKPKPKKPLNIVTPVLPPRPPLPIIPSLSSHGPTDITSSASSDSVMCPSNLEVHKRMSALQLKQKSRVLVFPDVHEDLKKVTEKIVVSKHQEVKSLVTDAPIYDDGVSEVLSGYEWFHGELEREEGARRVKQLSEVKNGTFLIRASKTDGTNNSHPYTLVVLLDNKVYNLKIRLRPDSRFAIGNYKAEEVSFSTVPELVEHHKENNIKLSEGGAVKLTFTPPK